MLELAEDELMTFFKVWTTVFVSLSYCYILGKLTPNIVTRLVAILPIIALFLVLPLKLTSIHLCGMSSFFIAWLANFKLILFAFNKGPLCSNSSTSFPHFLVICCLPIKIQQDPPQINLTKSQNDQNPNENSRVESHPNHEISQKSENNRNPNNQYYTIKVALFALIIKVYDYSDYIPQTIIWLVFFFHMYFILELVLAFLAALAEFFLGFELEPQFNDPLLATSLQDFWGKRWNIMVTKILRPTVYIPAMHFFSKFIGRSWAPMPAVMCTFLVSAIMHELIMYYIGRAFPTLEVTWFFLLHGFSLCVEVYLKKSIIRGRWNIPWWMSTPMTVSFVIGTGMWLFLPPLVRAGLYTRPFQDYAAVAKFARNISSQLLRLIT